MPEIFGEFLGPQFSTNVDYAVVSQGECFVARMSSVSHVNAGLVQEAMFVWEIKDCEYW